MSKIIRDCSGFTSPSSVIGPENSRFPQPIRCKTKTNVDLVSRVFPRFRRFACLRLSSHWLFRVFSFLLIGRCYHALKYILNSLQELGDLLLELQCAKQDGGLTGLKILDEPAFLKPLRVKIPSDLQKVT